MNCKQGLLLRQNSWANLVLSRRQLQQLMLKTNFGVLSATTAFGKIVIGAWLISKRKVNTLILVHRTQLQEQWIKLSSFLELPKNAIGRIGGRKKKTYWAD